MKTILELPTQTITGTTDDIAAIPGAAITLIEDTPRNKPNLENNLNQLYILWHRKGNDPRPAPAYFVFEGNLNDAIMAGRNYCNKVAIKFVRVSKFLLNFEDSLARYQRGGDAI